MTIRSDISADCCQLNGVIQYSAAPALSAARPPADETFDGLCGAHLRCQMRPPEQLNEHGLHDIAELHDEQRIDDQQRIGTVVTRNVEQQQRRRVTAAVARDHHAPLDLGGTREEILGVAGQGGGGGKQQEGDHHPPGSDPRHQIGDGRAAAIGPGSHL